MLGDVSLGPPMEPLRDYEGRSIRLTEERWVHISEHPEMVGMRTAVEEALQRPEIVVQSSGDPEARLYYRFYPRTVVGGKYLCAVVKVRGDDAFVVTAYLTDQVKRGSALWQAKP
ncbi:MAG TPA: hypothetical protein VM182_00245 [Terriglobia bacterium]|nr:hypothetical protein [Terriglobia bacterium]